MLRRSSPSLQNSERRQVVTQLPQNLEYQPLQKERIPAIGTYTSLDLRSRGTLRRAEHPAPLEPDTQELICTRGSISTPPRPKPRRALRLLPLQFEQIPPSADDHDPSSTASLPGSRDSAVEQSNFAPRAVGPLPSRPFPTPPELQAAAYASALLSLATPRRPLASTSRGPPLPPPRYPLSSPPNRHPARPDHENSVLHPRVAVLLGVERHWHLPLLFCRALSTAPAVWWGLRCALTFLRELLLVEGVEPVGAPWSVEKRFRVTEVFLALLWCCSSAWLSFYFTDCLMSRWLLNYTPQGNGARDKCRDNWLIFPATLVRLLSINSMNAYVTSWVLYLSGGSEDPRLLLPAWISIASTLTILYHLTHPRLAILKETSLSISVFSIASFITMSSLLLQLHLTRENDPPVPIFGLAKLCWQYVKVGVRMLGVVGRDL
ncbi:hypothetical protein JHW43_000823 [Diplocarpon mali]|nr:hypothetical protein JHW43_000823 [Diplocarpon mali]